MAWPKMPATFVKKITKGPKDRRRNSWWSAQDAARAKRAAGAIEQAHEQEVEVEAPAVLHVAHALAPDGRVEAQELGREVDVVELAVLPARVRVVPWSPSLVSCSSGRGRSV
jgi:hypothetical protein